jgi:hypothetical protein
VTALIAWPASVVRWKQVDNQMAAPAATRTPNLHRAKHSLNKSADGSMASVATRLGIEVMTNTNHKTT